MSDGANDRERDPCDAMRSIIQRIATGPELSKDISREEARLGMRAILDGEVDPVQAGIFLIALRMKRETDEENLGILDAVRDATGAVTAAVDEIVDLADPYDGYNRTLPISPFLPAVLAACGIPAVSHGVESLGPKYGVTHHQVLRAAGVPVDDSPDVVAARIGDPLIGWGYVDQRQFAPKLNALIGLRTLIVKRPAITTVEVLASPIRGRKCTHLVTGYVHKPYPRIYAMLARAGGFDSAVLVRGTEGGVIPSLRQKGMVVHFRDRGREESREIDPGALAINQDVRAVPLPPDLPATGGGADRVGMKFETRAVAQAAVRCGLDALNATAGPARDALVYGAAVCLWHLGRRESLAAAADLAREILDSGAAMSRFEAAVSRP